MTEVSYAGRNDKRKGSVEMTGECQPFILSVLALREQEAARSERDFAFRFTSHRRPERVPP